MNKFYILSSIKNTKGMILVFVALLMPVLLFFAILIIDGGRSYIKKNEFQHIAEQAANSGLIELSELLVKKANENKLLLCNLIPPEEQASGCLSNNMFDFLDENEIYSIINSPSNQSFIVQKVKEFCYLFQSDQSEEIKEDEIQVLYPYPDFIFEENKVSLQVKISKPIERMFESFLYEENIFNKNIIVKAISKLPLE